MINGVLLILVCIPLLFGLVECFAGYKIMKPMVSIWNFAIGAVLGIVVGVTSGTVLGIISVIIFGVCLGILAYKIYSAGVFVLIVFITTVALSIITRRLVISVWFGFVFAILSMFFVRHVVIISTSIAGAGIVLASAYFMVDKTLGDYPAVTLVLWIFLGVMGIFCQYLTTKNSPADARLHIRSFSEWKYPGMQRAYRNFCILCGSEMDGTSSECSRCGFSFDD